MIQFGQVRCWLDRGASRRVAALLALLGFLFTSTTPGLSLVAMAGANVSFSGAFGLYVCHAQSGAVAAPDADETLPLASDGCCLICQAAQLAGGTVPPQHFTLPTESAAKIRLAVVAQTIAHGQASGPLQPRAPPAA
ncbi:hypothetical protein [Magnetospirillum moscoviense]|uniref:DUF2946 domain-containing protein n=1 Tax=Magnetospirillum moscoviense TaxID=1437059 RepID=A0A178MGV9_9PROT|nr:hypothetical protein [Magnetospirillum moscoviense]MBF0326811.1 hypothetical protein [Alphaproteobacteria bacterium]OAN47896.1 hypothetical protein A6A05_03465 [Magnetospirillum moscoviense]